LGEIFPVRDLPSSYKLLIVDGVSGSGKTMISRLIDSAPESTSPSFLYEFEYFCQLYSMGFMSQESASTLIRSGLDLKYFNDSIGREVNLRPSDLSSILKIIGLKIAPNYLIVY
jgi:uridine kinase